MFGCYNGDKSEWTARIGVHNTLFPAIDSPWLEGSVGMLDLDKVMWNGTLLSEIYPVPTIDTHSWMMLYPLPDSNLWEACAVQYNGADVTMNLNGSHTAWRKGTVSTTWGSNEIYCPFLEYFVVQYSKLYLPAPDCAFPTFNTIPSLHIVPLISGVDVYWVCTATIFISLKQYGDVLKSKAFVKYKVDITGDTGHFPNQFSVKAVYADSAWFFPHMATLSVDKYEEPDDHDFMFPVVHVRFNVHQFASGVIAIGPDLPAPLRPIIAVPLRYEPYIIP